jgi:hypothetical protein
MTPSPLDRKRRFRMALAADGKTAEQWCNENGVNSSHLSLFLGGRENRRIAELVDRYSAETFKAYRVRVPKAA